MYTEEQNKLRKKIFEFGRNYSYNGNIAENVFWKEFGKSKFVKKTVRDYYNRKKAKIQVTELDRVKTRIKKNVDNNRLAEYLPSSGYSMGELKVISNRLIGQVGRLDNREYYAKSCSYRPKHGLVEVEFPIQLLAKAESADLEIIVRKKKVCNHIWKCDVVKFDYETSGRGIIKGDVKWHLEKAYLVEIGNTRTPYNNDVTKLLGHNVTSRKVVTSSLDEAKEIRKSVTPDEKLYKEWFAWQAKHMVIYHDKMSYKTMYKFGKKFYDPEEGIEWYTQKKGFDMWLVQTKKGEYGKVISKATSDGIDKVLIPISCSEAFEFSKMYYPEWVEEQERKLQESIEVNIDDKIFETLSADYD